VAARGDVASAARRSGLLQPVVTPQAGFSFTGEDDNSVQPYWDKTPHPLRRWERTAGYAGRDTTRRGPDVAEEATWTVAQLQELFEEWAIACWQNRPHEGLSHTWGEGRDLSPNGWRKVTYTVRAVPC